MPDIIGLLFLASPLVYVIGRQSRRINAYLLSVGLLSLLWIVWGAILIGSDLSQVMTFTLGTIRLNMDASGMALTTLALLLASLTIIFSFRDIEGQTGQEKYYAMIFILTGMVVGLVCAGDIFNLWVWFEGTAISSYLLVAFYNHQENALAACIKYFIQTAIGSVLVLFGIGLVLIENGTLDLARMTVNPSPLLVIAGTLFVMGFGVKSALFPNYTWLPDAYAESPTGVSALLSGVVTVSGLIALLKVLAVVAWSVTQWGILLLVIATLNIVVGNLLALAQTEIKRILAYSSITHIGFILLAVAIGITAGSQLAMRAAILHLFIHGLMKELAFLVVGALAYANGGDKAKRLTIPDLYGVGGPYPLMTFALVIALLSLTGVPLLAGFVSKWQIFIAGVETGDAGMIALMIFVAINSVFSLAYYLPIINALNVKDSKSSWQDAPDIPLSMRIPIVLLGLSIVLIGIFPNCLDWLVNPASIALYANFFA